MLSDQKHQLQLWRYRKIRHVNYDHDAIRRSEIFNTTVVLTDREC